MKPKKATVLNRTPMSLAVQYIFPLVQSRYFVAWWVLFDLLRQSRMPDE